VSRLTRQSGTLIGPYFKSRQLHFGVAVHESSRRRHVPPAECSLACVPRGRLGSAVRLVGGRWEAWRWALSACLAPVLAGFRSGREPPGPGRLVWMCPPLGGLWRWRRCPDRARQGVELGGLLYLRVVRRVLGHGDAGSDRRGQPLGSDPECGAGSGRARGCAWPQPPTTTVLRMRVAARAPRSTGASAAQISRRVLSAAARHPITIP
jgi:hypothetical protein